MAIGQLRKVTNQYFNILTECWAGLNVGMNVGLDDVSYVSSSLLETYETLLHLVLAILEAFIGWANRSAPIMHG